MQSPQTYGYCLSQTGILLQIRGLGASIEGFPKIPWYHIALMLEEFQAGSLLGPHDDDTRYPLGRMYV